MKFTRGNAPRAHGIRPVMHSSEPFTKGMSLECRGRGPSHGVERQICRGEGLERLRLNELLLFARNFLKHPKMLGSAIPSSRFLIDEVLDLALPELLDGASVTLIEWGDAIIPALPGEYLEVRLEYGEDDDERVIGVRPVGHRWLSRETELTRTLEGIQD